MLALVHDASQRAELAPERRPVPRTEGLVEADATGRLWLRGEPCHPRIRPSGYAEQWLPGRGKTLAHVAICEAFHGPQPSPQHQVDHLNADRSDNRPRNLTWATPEDNRARRRVLRGEAHPLSRIRNEDAARMRALFNSGVSQHVIARAWGVGRWLVHRVVTGQTYLEAR